MKLLVLVNPVAGSGSADRCLPRLREALVERGVEAEFQKTAGPGDAARLLRQARSDDVSCVAVVGGDGTLNEVSQAYLAPDGSALPGPDLAIIPSGTGGDFRKSFGLSSSLEEAVERLLTAPPRALDLGVLELMSYEGETIRRAFLNITSFGIGGLTDHIVNTSPKWLGGRAAFFLGALRALAGYRNAPVRVKVDGQVHVESPIVNVVIANGSYFGGGMHIAPQADPTDGLFDVLSIGDLSRLQNLRLAPHLYRGTHLGLEHIKSVRGKVVQAESLVPRAQVLIDMDGETPGMLPLTARIVPGAVRIRI